MSRLFSFIHLGIRAFYVLFTPRGRARQALGRQQNYSHHPARTVCALTVNPSCRAGTATATTQHSQKGQGMVEYVVIVALVAVAAIGVFQLFGQVIRAQTSAIALEMAGEDGTEMAQKASATAQASIQQSESKSLQSFTGNAQAGQ